MAIIYFLIYFVIYLNIAKFVSLKPTNMKHLNYEEFLEITWDYVSENVVSDEYWDNNHEFIMELTHDMYSMYTKSSTELPDGSYIATLTPRVCGKILENIFSRLIVRENEYSH